MNKKKKRYIKIGVSALSVLIIIIGVLVLTSNISPEKEKEKSKESKSESKDIKIYLSPAAHDIVNPCLYLESCNENIHSNEYVDYVEKRLKDLGFVVKRNSKNRVGLDGIRKAAEEANSWEADLYYVAHTNAFDEKTAYSLIMTDDTELSLNWANKLKQYRSDIYPRDIIIREDNALIECYAPKATTLYDELVFHDNIEDIKWFHQNMEKLADNSVEAICNMFDIKAKV